MNTSNTITQIPMSLSLKRNFSWTLIGNVVYSGCRWGMLVMLAKMGNPEMVGQFALGLAVVEPVVLFGNMHLRTVLATDTRQENDFRDCLGLRLITAVLTLLIVMGMSSIIGYRWETFLVIILVGLARSIESVSDVFYGLIQQRERMDLISKSLMIKGPLSLAMLGIGILVTGSLIGGVIGMTVVWLLVLVAYDIRCGIAVSKIQAPGQEVSLYEVSQGRGSVQPRWRLGNLRQLVVLALPLGVVMTLIALNSNIPRYFIEQYFGERELGIFAAVASFMSVGTMVVLALGQSAYPRLAKYYADGHLNNYLTLMLKLVGIALLIGIAGVLVAFVAGQQILELFFDREYARHVDVLLWTMAAAAIFYVASFMGYGITAARYFKLQVPLFVCVACTVTLACYTLVPTQGLRGAAIALLMAAVVQAVGGFCLLLYSVFNLLERDQGASGIVQPEKLDTMVASDEIYCMQLAKRVTDDPIQTEAQRISGQMQDKASKVQVSVIIPTHNRAEFLRCAITSVLNQTFQNFEVIVVDDASNDHSSAEVVKTFRDERIRFFRHEVNKGGSASRNTGLRAARGEYTAFLDDDDEWLPEKLALQLDVMAKSPPEVGCVYTGYHRIDEKSGFVLSRKIPTKKGDLRHELLSQNWLGSTSSVLLKKKCFEAVGLFDESLPSFQDYDMWIRISKKYQFNYVQDPLLRYRVHGKKISTNLEALERGLGVIVKKHGWNGLVLKRNFGYNYYLSLGTQCCLNQEVANGKKAYLNAIELYPFGIKAYLFYSLCFFGKDTIRKIVNFKNGMALAAFF